MSRIAQFCLLATVVCFASVFAVRYVFGGWIDWLWYPLGVGIAGLAAAAIIDYKFFLEFLTMKTTKHGLNMGTVIVLALAFLGTINFLGVRKDKTFDLTEEKLFSLSDQSREVLKELKEPLKLTILYKGQSARNELQMLRENLKLYQDASDKIQVDTYDAYVDNLKAQQYLNDQPDKNMATLFAFAEYGNRRERVDSPFSESEITSAIVKATRKLSKTLYFLTGHGERDLENSGEDGMKALKDDLEKYAAQVKTLNLVEKPEIPEDATAIIIAGPSSPLLDKEIQALKKYVSEGGKLLVFADPGMKHNLQQLFRPLGVDFSNTFVLDGGVRVQGVSPLSPAGTRFDNVSEITKPFIAGKSFALFHLASEVKRAPDAPKGLTFNSLVTTSDRGTSITEISETAQRGAVREYTMGVAAKGKLSEAAEAKETAFVMFSDSDFVTNKLLYTGVNRDLAMNAVAFLTGEKDLISVRPKEPKSTKLTMGRGAWLSVAGLSVFFPIAMFIGGAFIWFRRRGA